VFQSTLRTPASFGMFHRDHFEIAVVDDVSEAVIVRQDDGHFPRGGGK